MRKSLRRLFDKAGQLCFGIGRRLSPTSMERRVIPWFRDKGDSTHRQSYDLDESSVVFDLGGYEGQWASDIFSRYCCTVHIFEPVEAYAENIQKRFDRNGQINVHSFGLGSTNTEIHIGMGNDGSSAFKQAVQTTLGKLVQAKEFFDLNGISEVHLMKINIEGGEYELLEHLLDTGLTTKIQNIQVQFHDFVPNAEARMKSIQNRLSITHDITYQYEFIWENWKLKEVTTDFLLSND